MIEGYRPTSVGPEAAAFSRATVARVRPDTRARAKALLFACSKLSSFGLRVGLEPSREVLLSEAVIERFIACGTRTMSPATRRTVRTNLRFVATRLERRSPAPSRLSRDFMKPPYRAGEIASYLALSDAQPTASRRRRSSALLCLGAGAGLVGHELRLVRGRDVTARSGGVVVTVSGRRSRVVPVLSCYHDRLLEAAVASGEGLMLGGRTGDPNVVSRLTASLAGGPGLARIETGRLRSTWLVAVAGAVGLRGLMDAAGVISSQRLGELVLFLEPPSEEESVELLGGPR